jgi:hypothetical protein
VTLEAWFALAMGIYLIAELPFIQGTTWREVATDARELVRSLRS